CNWDVHIDSFLSGAVSRPYILRNRDSDLFNRIASYKGHVLYDLFRPKRNRALRDRGHDFILPRVKTELFKRAFVNRCLFRNI
ncbi:unnamed protein product, partial [Porites lobata]